MIEKDIEGLRLIIVRCEVMDEVGKIAKVTPLFGGDQELSFVLDLMLISTFTRRTSGGNGPICGRPTTLQSPANLQLTATHVFRPGEGASAEDFCAYRWLSLAFWFSALGCGR